MLLIKMKDGSRVLRLGGREECSHHVGWRDEKHQEMKSTGSNAVRSTGRSEDFQKGFLWRCSLFSLANSYWVPLLWSAPCQAQNTKVNKTWSLPGQSLYLHDVVYTLLYIQLTQLLVKTRFPSPLARSWIKDSRMKARNWYVLQDVSDDLMISQVQGNIGLVKQLNIWWFENNFLFDHRYYAIFQLVKTTFLPHTIAEGPPQPYTFFDPQCFKLYKEHNKYLLNKHESR